MILYKPKIILSTCAVALPFIAILYNLFCIPGEMSNIEDLAYHSDMIYGQLRCAKDKMNEYAHKTVGIDSLYEFEFGHIIVQSILRKEYEIVLDIFHNDAENIPIGVLLSSSEFMEFFVNTPHLIQGYIVSAEKPILSFSFIFRSKTGSRWYLPIRINPDGTLSVLKEGYEIVPVEPDIEQR